MCLPAGHAVCQPAIGGAREHVQRLGMRKQFCQKDRRRWRCTCNHHAANAVLCALLCTVCLCAPGYGQPHSLTFETLSIEQGLSQSIVFCVLQDRAGFLWFGTEDGLNRFDGYDFTVLRHDPLETNSLTYNEIRAMQEDSAGALWIATFYGGLNKYDPARRQFTHYRHQAGNANSLSHDNIRCLFADPEGTLWIGTEGGLNRLDRASGTFHQFLHHEDDPTSLSHDVVNAIGTDQEGGLWIGTDRGLNYLAPRRTGAPPVFQHYQRVPGEPNSLSNDTVTTIYKDRSGVLWVGTLGGLHRLVPATDGRSAPAFMRYRHEAGNPNSLSHNAVRAICEDENGVLWIGTNGGGLNLLTPERTRFIHFVNDPNDPASLSRNEILAIGRDQSGLMWLGTYGGGVCKAINQQKPFAVFRAVPHDRNSLPHEIVWALYEDDEGILWIGTHGGGLSRLDRQQQRYTHFQNDPADARSLSNNIVRVIHPSRISPQALWIGTNGGGLNKFDRLTRKFTRYQHDPRDPTSLSHNELRAIYEDRGGTLWVGTNGGGLAQLVAGGEAGAPAVFRHFRHQADDSTSLSNDFVRVIYEDPDEAGEVLWIGTQGGGLNRFDRRRGTFQHFRAVPGRQNSLNNDYIFCLHEDESGLFWIGTWGGGVNQFDRRHGAVAYYTTREGLSSNQIYGILSDSSGNLWMSSNQGLSRFNRCQALFKNFDVQDGLQSDEFNGGAYFKSRNGEMFFGGIHGFNAFVPERLRDNLHVPPVVITALLKFNKEVRLERDPASLHELHLSYKDYVFSFEFAALDFTAPMKNQYAYKMEGLDEEWIHTEAQRRFATYTTLAPGAYVFRVQGSNNDGRWNETGASLRVIIHPPLWKTWWLQTLAAVLMLSALYAGFRYRLNTVRMKTELRAAHNAQMSIMPQADPELSGFDISGICLPANEVGGDFFDYLWLDAAQTRFGIVVGDVSGKAMQSAMTAVMASGMIYAKADEGLAIDEIMTRLNRPVYAKTGRETFIALCLAAIDLPIQELTFTNAGLIEPLLKRDGRVMTLESAGSKLPLGATPDDRYQHQRVALRTGDVLIIVTDGIVEERNHAQQLYGEEALHRLLASLNMAALSAHDIKQKIVTAVKRFSGSTQQDDDMTVVVVKVL